MITKTQIRVLTTVMAFILALSLPSAFATQYAYQATNPDGGEITDIDGDMYTYLNHLDSNSKHVDVIAYVTAGSSLSVGVGYYDSQDSSGTETYKWVLYFDEGSTYDNFHYTKTTGPSTESWKTFDLWAVDSNTYDASIGTQGFTSRDCFASTCPNPTLAGAAAWSNAGSDPDDNIKAHFKNLRLKDGGWQTWQEHTDDFKCSDFNSDFDEVVTNDMDEVRYDVAAVDDCDINSSVWLYNGGGGG